MSLSRWDPFTEMTALRSAMDRLFEQSVVPTGRGGGEMMGGVPLDLMETDDAYVVKASLPGVKPDDVDISVHRNVLSITGETRGEEERGEGRIHHRERWFGRFRRQVSLPGDVDANACDASFEDGVLTIRLPKTEEARPKRISVGGGQRAIEGESRREDGPRREGASQPGGAAARGGAQSSGEGGRNGGTQPGGGSRAGGARSGRGGGA
jgi:HSP20 family protein